MALAAGMLLGGKARVVRARPWEAKVIGRMHFDGWDFDEDPGVANRIGVFEDGREPRRARLGFEAERGKLRLKLEWDHATNELAVKDGTIAWVDGPQGVTVGHHKEYFGLEQWTSTKYTTFIERATPDLFTPARDLGLSYRVNHPAGRLTWGVGLFEERDSLSHQVQDPGHSVTGRVTYLPWRKGEDKLLHVGLGLSFRNPGADEVRFRERPEAHLAPRVVDTGSFPATGVEVLGLEAAWVNGPLSLQGEWMMADLEAPTRGDPRFHGSYLYASWFATGEHRVYKQNGAAFGKVVPKRRSGAVELGIRYSDLDLDDAGVAGGSTDAWTFGVNWYMDAQTRLQVNYGTTDVRGVGEVDMLGVRASVFF